MTKQKLLASVFSLKIFGAHAVRSLRRMCLGSRNECKYVQFRKPYLHICYLNIFYITKMQVLGTYIYNTSQSFNMIIHYECHEIFSFEDFIPLTKAVATCMLGFKNLLPVGVLREFLSPSLDVRMTCLISFKAPEN